MKSFTSLFCEWPSDTTDIAILKHDESKDWWGICIYRLQVKMWGLKTKLILGAKQSYPLASVRVCVRACVRMRVRERDAEKKMIPCLWWPKVEPLGLFGEKQEILDCTGSILICFTGIICVCFSNLWADVPLHWHGSYLQHKQQHARMC